MTKIELVEEKKNPPKIVNHVVFVIDSSGSMAPHEKNVPLVFNTLLASMKGITGQEVRVSAYAFSNHATQLVYDQPASIVKEIKYTTGGGTALIDASMQAINDHLRVEQANAANKDEDHTFLVYVLTDGEELHSRNRPQDLKKLINGLNDSWTVAAMVPDLTGTHYAKNAGIPAGNIEIWNTNSARGFEEAGNRMRDTFTAYASDRAKGVRSTRSLFKVEAANLTEGEIRKNLSEVSGNLVGVQEEYQIRDFVEKVCGRTYKAGIAYYELSKRETVQPYKNIVIVNRKDAKKYGGAAARQLLGLPNCETDVSPGDFGEWRIFIQSTSFNRKVGPGTSVFIAN